MGVMISYQGRLKDRAEVPELVRDLQATAEAAGWQFRTMEQLIAEGRVTCSGLQGITLYPHRECEPVHIHVDAAGELRNHMYFSMLQDGGLRPEIVEALAASSRLVRDVRRGLGRGDEEEAPAPEREPSAQPEPSFFEKGSRYLWTKTQFAGAPTHVAVCEVLRYVQQRYAPGLTVRDDTGYFETGDLAKLEGELALVDRLVGAAKRSFEAVARGGPTTLAGLLARLGADLREEKDALH